MCFWNAENMRQEFSDRPGRNRFNDQLAFIALLWTPCCTLTLLQMAHVFTAHSQSLWFGNCSSPVHFAKEQPMQINGTYVPISKWKFLVNKFLSLQLIMHAQFISLRQEFHSWLPLHQWRCNKNFYATDCTANWD